MLSARRFVASIWPDRAYVNRRAHSIWTSLDASPPQFQATCCLYQLGPDIAVITAAHAMVAEQGRQFVVGADARLFNLWGEGRWASTAERGRKGEDSLDVQVVVLDRSVSEQMPRTGLVCSADVEHLHNAELDPAFLLSGFPASRQRTVAREKRTDSDLHSLVLAPAPPLEGESEPHHIEMTYDQRDLYRDGQRITSVAPRGMSGAGVWRLSRSRYLGDRRRLQLAGILIERKKGARAVLLATRISYALRMIIGIDPRYAQYLPSWVTDPI